MSLHEYLTSVALDDAHPPFYALIMAAMRQAGGRALAVLQEGFPEVWNELLRRYNAPGGVIHEDDYKGEWPPPKLDTSGRRVSPAVQVEPGEPVLPVYQVPGHPFVTLLPRCQAESTGGAQCLLARGHGGDHEFREDTAAVWQNPGGPDFVSFTVYESPRDFPGRFVVRRFAVVRGNVEPVPDPNPWAVTGTIEEARASLPPGLVRTERHPEDDPVIVETWI